MNTMYGTNRLSLCLTLLMMIALTLSACAPAAPATNAPPDSEATEPPAASEPTVDPNAPTL